MGDNYAEKQHTRQCGLGNTVHIAKKPTLKQLKKVFAGPQLPANGASISRPMPGDQRMTPQERARQHADLTPYWLRKHK